MTQIFFILLIHLSHASSDIKSSCVFYIQHHFVQESDVNKALALELNTFLESWKDTQSAPKIIPPKQRKGRKKVKPCVTPQFIASDSVSLKGKWAQANSAVLYMVTWLKPEAPDQKKIQLELFVSERPTPRRLWIEGPMTYKTPEPSLESKNQWVTSVAQMIVDQSLAPHK